MVDAGWRRPEEVVMAFRAGHLKPDPVWLHRAAAGRWGAEWGAVVAAVLLARGVRPDTADHLGRTPLHRAAEVGYGMVADLLLAAGADPDARDLGGRTPLWRVGGAFRGGLAWCWRCWPPAPTPTHGWGVGRWSIGRSGRRWNLACCCGAAPTPMRGTIGGRRRRTCGSRGTMGAARRWLRRPMRSGAPARTWRPGIRWGGRCWMWRCAAGSWRRWRCCWGWGFVLGRS